MHYKVFYIWLNIEETVSKSNNTQTVPSVSPNILTYPDNLEDIASLIKVHPKLIFCFKTILNPYNAIGKRI